MFDGKNALNICFNRYFNSKYSFIAYYNGMNEQINKDVGIDETP